jgi:arginine repressor
VRVLIKISKTEKEALLKSLHELNVLKVTSETLEYAYNISNVSKSLSSRDLETVFR